MSEIIVLQHVATEDLGTIAIALDARGLAYRYVRGFDGEPIPTEIGDIAGLIVMGGPMGVYEQDKYPFLNDELRLIESALSAQVPVLGVCLGSQLLASALGTRVHPGPRIEVGWYPTALTADGATDPIWRSAPGEFMGLHWHGDVFDVPDGAVSLASTKMTACQSFRYGDNAYGILLHLEVTEPMIRTWTAADVDWLAKGGVDPQSILAGIAKYRDDLDRIGRGVFGAWVELVKP